MDYEKLIYVNERGESLEFGVASIFYCNVSKDVEGISGVHNTLYTTNSMGQHGDTFTGQRIEAREITVAGVINTKDKAQGLTLRRQMLKILNPDLKGTLTYIYKNFRRVIDCRMSGEPVFRREKVLISYDLPFECLDPFWREEKQSKEEIVIWAGAWEFPCSIEKNNPENMIFGYRTESLIVNCYNGGDVPTGMQIRFTALGAVRCPVLFNVNTQEFIQINTTMQAGDVITINTGYGRKGAQLKRGGTESDYFRYIDVDSTFMQLEIGDNLFKYDAESGVDALEVIIFYDKKYLGV